MSTLKTKNVQIGTSAVNSSDNYTLYQSAVPDGSLRLGRGSFDSATDVAILTGNNLSFLGNISATDISANVFTEAGTSLSSKYAASSHNHVIADITDLDPEALGKWSNSPVVSSDIFYSSGSVGIGTNSPGESLDVVGNVKASGDFISLSDVSLKENIEPIGDSLSIIEGLNGVFFNFVDEDRRQVGFIAQDVEGVLPEVVFEFEGLKSVSYSKVVAVLVEAVKELKREVEELKNGV